MDLEKIHSLVNEGVHPFFNSPHSKETPIAHHHIGNDPQFEERKGVEIDSSCGKRILRDEVILHCYQPKETIRPAYGAWCLVCCAICPLPTGLTYVHLKPLIL